MAQAYQLGFTPFATPLQALNLQVNRVGLKASWIPRERVTVVGFRQKRAALVLVTPDGRELYWQELNDTRALVRAMTWTEETTGQGTPYIIADHIEGALVGEVFIDEEMIVEGSW